MQQRGCEAIEVLLSKYADNEATPTERERVESHIIGCPLCARRLTEYREVSALFSASPKREPEPQLRVKLFREIGNLKEEEQRRQRGAERSRPWYLPAPAPARSPRKGLSRLSGAASSFLAVAMVALASLAFIQYVNKTPVSPEDVTSPQDVSIMVVVPTVPATIAVGSSSLQPGDDDVVTPVSTSQGPIRLSPVVEGSATVYPTAHVGEDNILKLRQSTPVLEGGDESNLAWHVVRDAVYGYTISYPPNWWTNVNKGARFFYPWTASGTRYAPYWIDLRVEANPEGLTLETAPSRLGEGAHKEEGATWVRRLTSDQANRYDELFRFDEQNMYVLRLTVPRASPSGDFGDRWDEAQAIFSPMSGRIAFAEAGTAAGYAPVLFLNGTQLWSMDGDGARFRITQGGSPVQRFALSPDLRTVAYLTARYSSDVWAEALWVTTIESRSAGTPTGIWVDKGLKIYDLAWYGDHELVVIARSSNQGFGIFRISLPRATNGEGDAIERILELDDDESIATGLAVAPDRQLITFLYPVGESKGTNIYAMRPDGTDLKTLVPHEDPMSSPAEGNIFAPGGGAIKSYIWLNGRLENDGYRYSLVFTFGNATSPALYRGGSLYSAPGAKSGPALDLETLGKPDTDRMDLIHVAYSPGGRLAMAGFYHDYNGKAEILAGLWTADVSNGRLANVTAHPIPAEPHGIADLQWSPDGRSLIYRETFPQKASSLSGDYEPNDPFRIMKLDLNTGGTTLLFNPQP